MLIKYIYVCTYFFLCVPFRDLYNQRIGNYSQKTRGRTAAASKLCSLLMGEPKRLEQSVEKRVEGGQRAEGSFVENAKF